MVSTMDSAIGSVLDQLAAKGIDERTLIFFLSDNGGPTTRDPKDTSYNRADNGPLRGFKWDTYQGGIRVPFCARWKGTLPADQVFAQPVISLDIAATALAAAHAEPVAGTRLDGVNLLPFLSGQRSDAPHEALYWRNENLWATGPNDTPPDALRQNINLFTGKSFTTDEARAALHAYYACVSYMDAHLGRVLDALEKNGLRDNTIIVFWGDHGWHLGDKGMWAKGTLFETTARGPLLIADPRQKTSGQSCARTVQYLDMHPTLTDLCGITAPTWLEGTSLKPLLANPQAEWDKPAFTVQPRHWFIGRSIRTDRWRYTEWDEGRRGMELYDHEADPHEMRNLATAPAHHDTVAKLQQQLRESKVGQSMRRN